MNATCVRRLVDLLNPTEICRFLFFFFKFQNFSIDNQSMESSLTIKYGVCTVVLSDTGSTVSDPMKASGYPTGYGDPLHFQRFSEIYCQGGSLVLQDEHMEEMNTRKGAWLLY